MEFRAFVPEFNGFVNTSLQDCSHIVKKLVNDFKTIFELPQPESGRRDKYSDVNEDVGLKIRGSLSLEMKLRTEIQQISISDSGQEMKFQVEEWVKSPLGKITQNYNSIVARARPILESYHIDVQPVADALHTDARCSIDKKISKVTRGGFLFGGITAELDIITIHNDATTEKISKTFYSFCLEGKFRQIEQLLTGDLRSWAIDLFRVLQRIENIYHSSRTDHQMRRQVCFGCIGGYPTFIRRFMDSCVGLDAYSSPPLLSSHQSLIYTAYRQGFSICHAFAVLIVRHPRTHDYLAVLETGGRGWWIPGGHVENGEALHQAGLRECLEESGVNVTLKGILSIEFVPKRCEIRLRVVFYAEPVDDNCEPKNEPDEHSLRAEWVSIGWIRDMDMRTRRSSVDGTRREDVFRGYELSEWSQHIESGKIIHDLSVLDGLSSSWPLVQEPSLSLSLAAVSDVNTGFSTPLSDVFDETDVQHDCKQSDDDGENKNNNNDDDDDDDVNDKALFKFAKKGDTTSITTYLNQHADQFPWTRLVNYLNNSGWTLLHAAIKSGHMSTISLILGLISPDVVMAVNDKKRSALHFIKRHLPKENYAEALGLVLLRLPTRALRQEALQLKDDQDQVAFYDVDDDDSSDLRKIIQLL